MSSDNRLTDRLGREAVVILIEVRRSNGKSRRDGPVHPDAMADVFRLACERGDGSGRHQHVRNMEQLSATAD
jgi:hypothetical protein